MGLQGQQRNCVLSAASEEPLVLLVPVNLARRFRLAGVLENNLRVSRIQEQRALRSHLLRPHNVHDRVHHQGTQSDKQTVIIVMAYIYD